MSKLRTRVAQDLLAYNFVDQLADLKFRMRVLEDSYLPGQAAEKRYARVLQATVAWDPASLADGAVASTTVTVDGARVGEPVLAGHDQIGSVNVLLSAHVQAADTVRVMLMNKTGGVLDIGSGDLTVCVLRLVGDG